MPSNFHVHCRPIQLVLSASLLMLQLKTSTLTGNLLENLLYVTLVTWYLQH